MNLLYNYRYKKHKKGTLNMNLNDISNVDKVSVIALGKQLEKELNTHTLKSASDILNISIATENRNREKVLEKIKNKADRTDENHKATQDFANNLIKHLLVGCDLISKNQERVSYSPLLKEIILTLKKEMKDDGENITFQDISIMTGIPVETLYGFEFPDYIIKKEEMSNEHEIINAVWNKAPKSIKKSLDCFYVYLGKTLFDNSFSFKQMVNVLTDLGHHYPRGPKMENKGAQVKKKFLPHAIWEGDGKNTTIVINGNRYNFLWYAFTDQTTTLLVGGSLSHVENSDAFLKALKNGESTQGIYPIGVLIDNRLGESDLSSVQSFCKNHGITIVRTFPGNSKSNGFIENNFSVFERFVGEVCINGNSEEEIATQIARNIIEIFTQQRNHTPRKRLGGKTPLEEGAQRMRPVNERSKIEKLSQRLDKKETLKKEKMKLLEPLLSFFRELDEHSLQKFEYHIKQYSQMDIIASQAAFFSQCKKNPEKIYTIEYFMAILRNQCEERAKRAYNEVFRAGMAMKGPSIGQDFNMADIADIIVDEIENSKDLASQAERYCKIEAIAFTLVQLEVSFDITDLWKCIEGKVVRNVRILSRYWLAVAGHLQRILGDRLYFKVFR